MSKDAQDALGAIQARAESTLCCTLYDIQCICRVARPGCRCRCKGCTCGPLTVRASGTFSVTRDSRHPQGIRLTETEEG
jgi:hypothetical protein